MVVFASQADWTNRINTWFSLLLIWFHCSPSARLFLTDKIVLWLPEKGLSRGWCFTTASFQYLWSSQMMQRRLSQEHLSYCWLVVFKTRSTCYLFIYFQFHLFGSAAYFVKYLCILGEGSSERGRARHPCPKRCTTDLASRIYSSYSSA